MSPLRAFLADLRYAVRGLRRNPGFAAASILSLTLGVGASLAIFTIADNLLLRPMPYRDPSRLVMVWEKNSRQPGMTRNVISPGNYLDWQTQNDVFGSMSVFRDGRSVLADGDHVEELGKQSVTAEFFPLLGVNPIRGRVFTKAEDLASAHTDTLVLISYRLWQSWFGGEDSVIGRKVLVNSEPRTIIGVMPPDFYFRNREIDLWDPLGLDPAVDFRKTQGRWAMCVARLKSGISAGKAQARMAALAQRIEEANPVFDKNWGVNVEPLRESLVYNVKTSLLVLLGAAGLLLAVACANAANLLLARCVSRRREMAVRASLGAGRGRLGRQLLTESLLTGIASGALGLLFARAAVAGLLKIAPQDLTRSAHVVMDIRVVWFAVALAVSTGALFGLAPALMASRVELIDALRERAGTGGSARLRSVLVAAEVAFSVMLLSGAILLFRSMVGLQAVDPGMNPANLLTFRVTVPAARYREVQRRVDFYARIAEETGRLPGVRGVSAISYLPFDGDAAGTYVDIAGRPPARPGEELLAIVRTVLPGYFRVMGIPLRRGRDFTAADNTVVSPYRFIVNEAFVRKYFGAQNPLDAQLSVRMDHPNPFGQIIGVAGDLKEDSLDSEAVPTVYYVHAHLAYSRMVFVARCDRDPSALSAAVRRTVHNIDAAQPVAQIRTMEEILGETYSRQRFAAMLLVGFSIAALLVAAIGIYGVLAYSVTERTREIGIRAALGAEPGRIVSLIMSVGARFVAAGVAVGLAGALALSGLLKSLLFGVGPHDPITFAAVAAALVVVALIAAYVPARRAARLNPVEALRAE